jgi:glyoxalase family protein
LGIHHVTALAGDPQPNLDYYRGPAGMRLVKRTVNYDDPASLHFYYGDSAGSIGSLLTFFPWGHVRQQRKGAGQAIAVAFMAPPEAVAGQDTRFGSRFDTVLDPDGMTLERVATPGASGVRLHSATICVAKLDEAERLLGETLELARVGRENNRVRYAAGPNQFVDLVHDPAAEPGKMGAGSIHHIALRCGTDEAQLAWRERLKAAGVRVSPVKDRNYFHSIYFRCAGNALFEIATDGPGFTIDEPAQSLGQKLCLPPWLEPHRAEISARLASYEL